MYLIFETRRFDLRSNSCLIEGWPCLSLNCVSALERLSDCTLLFAWHCGTGTGDCGPCGGGDPATVAVEVAGPGGNNRVAAFATKRKNIWDCAESGEEEYNMPTVLNQILTFCYVFTHFSPILRTISAKIIIKENFKFSLFLHFH